MVIEGFTDSECQLECVLDLDLISVVGEFPRASVVAGKRN